MVLATGGRVPDEDLGAVPDWVRVEDFVPQVAVLHRADAFVTHAGMGPCTEALWCGVPTVAVPQAVDQFGNAEQLAAIGVGVHLASDPPSPDDLRAALLGVAGDPDVRWRLDAISAELRRDGGPDHAADAVEDVATGTW
jgi:MGT family glycosyltransferase